MAQYVVVATLVQEIDACNAFIRTRPIGSTKDVARAVRVMEAFLAQYVRQVDGDRPVESERGDDAVERRDEVVGDEVAAVAHA